MSSLPQSAFSVRRIRTAEWRQARDLRLRALRDPNAPIAFLDTVENASAQPDEFWRERAERAAEGDTAQFVAIAENGEWFGTATALPNRERPRTGVVVGVYVADRHRGAGAIEALLDAVEHWAALQRFTALFLEVHVDNGRAQAAYEKSGFVRTGEVVDGDNGRDHVMVRPIRTAAR